MQRNLMIEQFKSIGDATRAAALALSKNSLSFGMLGTRWRY